MLVGAAIGVQSENIWTAFCFGLMSHYLLDFLPHWDYLKKIEIDKPSHFIKIFLDFILGVSIVIVLVWGFPQKLPILFALLGALLPDVSEFFYSEFKIKFLRPFHNFHHKVHYWKRLPLSKGLPLTLFVSLSAVFIIILSKWG
jgi:hypothetical protein